MMQLEMFEPTAPPTIGTVEVCRLTGASFRQIDYWVRLGLVDGMETRTGSGGRRKFTPTQVQQVEKLVRAAKLRAMPLGKLAQQLDS